MQQNSILCGAVQNIISYSGVQNCISYSAVQNSILYSAVQNSILYSAVQNLRLLHLCNDGSGHVVTATILKRGNCLTIIPTDYCYEIE